MAIENLISELNDSIKALTKALSGATAPESAPAPAKKKAPVKKKAPAKKTPAKKKAPAKKRGLSYDRDVKPQVLIAISTPEGREEVKDLLGSFNVVKAPDLEADDYPEFLRGIEEIIEKYDDE